MLDSTIRRQLVLVVHGFAVAPQIFLPMLTRLKGRSLDPILFRYPSVGLSFDTIVDRLVANLISAPPQALIAHSLGCMIACVAVRKTGWVGPIVLLAPPFATLPVTWLIPKFLRWPFAPLLDHRMLTSRSNYKPPNLTGCRVKTIAGRYDFLVPMHCSRNPNVQEIMLTNHTHNSLLLSSSIAEDCCEWISRP